MSVEELGGRLLGETVECGADEVSDHVTRFDIINLRWQVRY